MGLFLMVPQAPDGKWDHGSSVITGSLPRNQLTVLNAAQKTPILRVIFLQI